MNVYEVPHPNLDIHVQYRVLTGPEIETISLLLRGLPNDEYTRMVLENVILNLKTDVTEALRKISKDRAKVILNSLFNGSIMLNPGLDFETWIKISGDKVQLAEPTPSTRTRTRTNKAAAAKAKKISRAHFLNLERHLQERVIGQDTAIAEVVAALRRSQVGLADERRPIGVFLFAGASGVGKTLLARELHQYLYGSEYDLVRIDCGEFQHKHENSKLIGAPPGYLGYDEGGQLTNKVAKHPQTVVLLDEVEKAHTDLWNTFLRVFDEGMLTDGQGKEVSFRDALVIMTTNLGNRKVVEDSTEVGVGFSNAEPGLPSRARVERLAHKEIKKTLSPEFLNRIDRTVVFNHLQERDFQEIAALELAQVDAKLTKRGFSLTWDTSAIEAMVEAGECVVQGARKLAQVRRDDIENLLAETLLNVRYARGTVFQLSWDKEFFIEAHRPRRSTAPTEITTVTGGVS